MSDNALAYTYTIKDDRGMVMGPCSMTFFHANGDVFTINKDGKEFIEFWEYCRPVNVFYCGLSNTILIVDRKGYAIAVGWILNHG